MAFKRINALDILITFSNDHYWSQFVLQVQTAGRVVAGNGQMHGWHSPKTKKNVSRFCLQTEET